MARERHSFDLAGLRLSAGRGAAPGARGAIEPLALGGERYAAEPAAGAGRAGRLADDGRRLRAAPALHRGARGPVHALPERGAPRIEVEAREVDTRRAAARSCDSPYVEDEMLDLAAWARDAFALRAPAKVLCREDCAGLCPVCAADLERGRSRAPPRARARSALGEAARAEARVALAGRAVW